MPFQSGANMLSFRRAFNFGLLEISHKKVKSKTSVLGLTF